MSAKAADLICTKPKVLVFAVAAIGSNTIKRLKMKKQSEKVKEFLSDITSVCKNHGLSISHEDYQGAFIVENYKENNIEWLKAAFDETES